jgi:molybdopterin molybdotransferase
MGEITPMLTFEQARAKILEGAPRLGVERVPVVSACDRVLAESVRSPVDLPGFDYSAMDGYAVRSADLNDAHENNPVLLRVHPRDSRAGGDDPPALGAGECVRTFTGARIADGADAVEMQENALREGDLARFTRPARPGQHVRRRGEDLREGQIALEARTRLGPAHLALLTALGRVRVTVARRPVVTIVSTGDELRSPEEPDRPGSVIECISPALSALVAQCGGLARVAPFVRDSREAVGKALSDALAGSDLVLTVGGVSVGEYDVVRESLVDAGVSLDFWKVAIKPGKPLALGHRGPARWLGLPGNPASALLTFTLFGAPLLRAMQGDARAIPPMVGASLSRPVEHGTGRLEFLRATLDEHAWPPRVTTLKGQASGSVVSMAWADGYAALDADRARWEAGETVRVLRVRDV